MNNYREIEFPVAGTIDEAVEKLNIFKIKNHKVKGFFNGQWLYSDIDDLDSAYKKITGLAKSEFDEKQKQRQEEYEKHKREHKEKIPELTQFWIKEGHKILDKSKWEYWDKCVPIRLNDLYEGMELKCCLDIIKILQDDHESIAFDKADLLFRSQGHSGMSHSLVCSMIISFCDKGKEFIKYINRR